MKPVHVKIDNKDCVIISEKLYSGLVRALAWKIEYQDRVKRVFKQISSKPWLIESTLYPSLEKILKGEK